MGDQDNFPILSIEGVTNVGSGRPEGAKVLLPHEQFAVVIENGKIQTITAVTSDVSSINVRDTFARFLENNPRLSQLVTLNAVGFSDEDISKIVFALYATNTIEEFEKILGWLGLQDSFEEIFIVGFSEYVLNGCNNDEKGELWSRILKEEKCRYALYTNSQKSEDETLVEKKDEIYGWYFLLIKRYLVSQIQGDRELDPLSY